MGVSQRDEVILHDKSACPYWRFRKCVRGLLSLAHRTNLFLHTKNEYLGVLGAGTHLLERSSRWLNGDTTWVIRGTNIHALVCMHALHACT